MRYAAEMVDPPWRPLHNVLSTKYVVHTHALLVNGMTCAIEGEEVVFVTLPRSLVG